MLLWVKLFKIDTVKYLGAWELNYSKHNAQKTAVSKIRQVIINLRIFQKLSKFLKLSSWFNKNQEQKKSAQTNNLNWHKQVFK